MVNLSERLRADARRLAKQGYANEVLRLQSAADLLDARERTIARLKLRDGSAPDIPLDSRLTQLQINRAMAPYLSKWEHRKGGIYRIRMHVLLEATLEPAVVYYPAHGDPDLIWCRPAREFFDGRFTRIEGCGD